MKLIIKAKLENVFKARDFKSKDGTTESKGKWQLQFMEKIEGDEGFQINIHKVSIPDEKAADYKNKIGSVIEVPVKSMALKNKVIYYGV
ncbi:MAG TPA: hypothetical protein EYP02_03680 [Sulfurovum sp.]|nr:hypothetical protein [Sulfurovum sp.]